MERLLTHNTVFHRNLIPAFVLCFALLTVVEVTAQDTAQDTADPVVYAGRVVFEDQPVEGAEVYIGTLIRPNWMERSKPELMAHTGKDGTFTFTYLGNNDMPVTEFVAVCPGYSIGVVSPSRWMDLKDIVITLHRPSSISGIVITNERKPIADAIVYLSIYEMESTDPIHPYRTDMPGLAARTDINGRFQFNWMPEGSRASFVADKQGFIMGGYYQYARSGTKDLEIILSPASSISGRVTIAESGEPVAGIQVSMIPFAGVSSVATDEDGHYIFEGVDAGTYRINAISDVKHLGLCARETDRLVVNQGETRDNIDIVMSPGVIVNGTVTDKETGEPIEGCSVRVMPRRISDILYSLSITDTAGRFQATVLPGNAYFRAFPLPGYSGVVTDDTEQLHVVSAAGVTGDVHLRLTKEPVISGTVYLPDGSPAKGARVVTSDGALTDISGHFTLEVSGHNSAYAVKVEMSELGLEGEAIVNTALNEPVEIHLQPYRYTSVTGVLLDSDGNSVTGMSIERYRSASLIGLENASAAISGPDGSFTVDSLRIGLNYVLGVRNLQARTRAIEAGVDTGPYTLVLPVADRWLEGRVIDEDGEPVSGLNIHISSATSGRQVGTTDENGLFRIDNLTSETEGLYVGVKYYRDIPTNTFQELILYENRERTLAGNIIDTDGNPVKNAILTFENPYGLYNAQRAADQTGRFLLQDLIGKALVVTITSDGYEPLTIECETDTDNNTFVMSPISSSGQ